MTAAETKLKENNAKFACKVEVKDAEIKRISNGLNTAFGRFTLILVIQNKTRAEPLDFLRFWLNKSHEKNQKALSRQSPSSQ